MADHEELVAEMPILEQMGTQERQKLAKKRRLQQLKKWGQREKEWIAKERQLNKRLANILHEENNGLNLKQYTQYGSNQRTKKKVVNGSNNHSIINGINGKDKSNGNNNNNNNNININNTVADTIVGRKEADSLQPNGRVHFNIGVMLLEAAARNDIDEVRRLLSLGVSPDSINHDGLTALHQCCIDASEPMMNLLLEYGADVDARDTEQWTPLHAACTCGHLNLVKILVEHGADLLAVNGDGNMPFDVCEEESTLDYIESQMVSRGITQEMIDLARASAEMQMLNDLERLVGEGKTKELNNSINEDGVTYLHVAAANGYLSATKYMLKHGVNVNVCDNDLWRPIHGAACWGNEQHCKIVELLVEAGADLNAKTINDETVFDLCDHVDLLDKLNQLKDEYENKRASGGDRLRRTQSRTNSRVHSVRRTSVRDKNQISRREARQEALLRTESSDKIQPTTKVEDSNGPPKKLETDLDAQLPPPSHEIAPDTVDSSKNGNEVAQNDNESISKNGDDESSNRSQSTSVTIEAQSKLNHHISAENQSESQPITTSNGEQRVTGTRIIATASSGPDLNSPKTTRKSSSIVQVNIQNNGNHRDKEHNNPILSSNNNNNNSDACDLPHQQIVVHLTPLNYTLSNLKKHRSDLRMRSLSIGTNNNSLDTIDKGSIISQNKDNNVDAGNGITSEQRSESPRSTYRKFHGEPSDTIYGNVGRKSRHKCCTLI